MRIQMAAAALIVVAFAPSAAAQTTAGWKEGFFIASSDGDSELNIGGYLHFDARFFADDPDERNVDQLTFRRIRPTIGGKVLKAYEFRLMPDFAGGRVVVQDAYVDIHHLDAVRLRAGKFKAPFGLERLQSATAISFVERAFPTSLAPNRDLGIQVHGELFSKLLAYQVGVFDGVADGGSGDGDVADDKELAARVFVQPFVQASPWLAGFGVGGAVTWGDKTGSVATTELPVLRTAGQAQFFTYRVGTTLADTAVAAGNHTRLTAQGHYYGGPIGLLAEWVQSTQTVAFGMDSIELSNQAWQIAAQWVIGGTPAFKGVTVEKPFDPSGGGFGAVEIAARYTGIRIDEAAFPTFADPARSAAAADEFSAGLSWLLNRQLKLVFDFERTVFDGGDAGGDRPAETVFLGRLQTVF